MTPDECVYQTLITCGMRGTKTAWQLGQVPPLPWFTYKHVKGGELFADDRNYAKMHRYEIDLYQKECDEDEREAFEDVLTRIGPWKCLESWIPAENAWITSYSATFHPDN